MEVLKKFTSRKFLIQLGGLIFSILAILYGENNESVMIIGQIGVIVFPLAYIVVETYLDGKALSLKQTVPTFARTINDLVQLYEEKYGEDGITNFIQDFMALLKRHFEEDQDIKRPEVTQ